MTDRVKGHRRWLVWALALLLTVVAVGVVPTFAHGRAGAALAFLAGAGVAVVLITARGATGTRGTAERDRSILVRACVEVNDAIPSAALAEQLADALAEVGVTQVEVAAGEPFDSAHHHAVGRVGTRDRGRHNLVARTDRPGYVDRGRRLRYPDVIVFNADRSSQS